MNDEGVVAGYLGSGSDYDAVVWRDGTTTLLDTPQNTIRSDARGINNLGQLVGSVTLQTDAGVRQQAVLWSADGDYTLLGFFEGGYSSWANDINDLGQVVGLASRPGTAYTAFLWEGNGLRALPVPAGPPCPPNGCFPQETMSWAVAINNQGQTAGWIGYPYQPARAVVWESDSAHTPVFLTPLVEGRGAQPFAINDSGHVVGYSSSDSSIGMHAVLWHDDDVVDLGDGGGRTIARGINNAGLIVGATIDSEGREHATVWDASVSTLLPTLDGDVLSSAPAVNMHDVIVGSSRSAAGVWQAVIWTRRSDTTPPVITGATDMSVNASSPAGAVVEFTITATDETPGNPEVACSPPSGSVFPIGDTTVVCTATDEAGNTASAGFTVTVQGAAAQLTDLRAVVQGVGPGTSLADKVMDAQAAYTAGDPARTCEILHAFINQVKAQTGRSITDPATADSLIADATRIRAVLGC